MSIMNNLQRLVLLLEDVEKYRYEIPVFKGENKTNATYYFDPENEHVYYAERAAAQFLFDNRGFLKLANKQALLAVGYNTIFIEKDEEFGWLTVGIEFTLEFHGEERRCILPVYNDAIWTTINRYGIIKRGN